MKTVHLMNVPQFLSFNNSFDFSGSAGIPSDETTNPKKTTHEDMKVHLLILVYNCSLLRETNHSQIIQMLFLSATVNQDVVKIDDKKFAYEWSWHLCHNPHECTRCI